MDYGTFSGLYTIFLIFIFIGLFIWVFSKKRSKSFNKAANIIFEDDASGKTEADSDDKDQGVKQ